MDSPAPGSDNVAVRQALIAGWVAFVVLMLGASPAHFWLDSGEIGAAGVELGVIHPPGAPGYVLLLRAASALPIGSLGFRMSLLSCLLAAAAVMGVFLLLRRRGAHGWICWSMTLWLLAAWTFVRHGKTIEIYALGTALTVAVLWGFDPQVPAARRTAARLLGVFAAVWGVVGFGDLRLALVLPIVLGWVLALRRGRPWAAWAPLLVVAALATVPSLPLASVRGPLSDWGDPDTMRGFVSHLQAESIRSAYAEEILPASTGMWQHNLQAFVTQLTEDLGPPGLVLAVAALLGLWVGGRKAENSRTKPWSSLGVAAGLTWLASVELFYAVGINPMGIVDRQTGMVLLVLAALAVGEQTRRLLSDRPRLQWALVPLLACILVLPAALVSAGDLGATRSWAPHAWTRKAIQHLPPGTLLLTQSDDLSAGMAAARMLEGARPDLVSIPGQHLHKPIPEAWAPRPDVVQAWRFAQAAPTEAARVEAMLARWPGPVALEHPATSVFKGVTFWTPTGEPPLRWTTPESTPGRTPLQEARTAVEYWSPRLDTREDRQRLATALANHARALARVHGDVDGAISVLELVLTRVTAHHAGSLVALAALQDFLGHTDRAIDLTRRALVLEPGRAVALTNLALYLSRDPRTRDEALAWAKRAVHLRPWRADGWARLAEVSQAVGDAAGAEHARARAEALRSAAGPSSDASAGD